MNFIHLEKMFPYNKDRKPNNGLLIENDVLFF